MHVKCSVNTVADETDTSLFSFLSYDNSHSLALSRVRQSLSIGALNCHMTESIELDER